MGTVLLSNDSTRIEKRPNLAKHAQWLFYLQRMTSPKVFAQ